MVNAPGSRPIKPSKLATWQKVIPKRSYWVYCTSMCWSWRMPPQKLGHVLRMIVWYDTMMLSSSKYRTVLSNLQNRTCMMLDHHHHISHIIIHIYGFRSPLPCQACKLKISIKCRLAFISKWNQWPQLFTKGLAYTFQTHEATQRWFKMTYSKVLHWVTSTYIENIHALVITAQNHLAHSAAWLWEG